MFDERIKMVHNNAVTLLRVLGRDFTGSKRLSCLRYVPSLSVYLHA
jgi:hypothetical protein